MKNEPQLTIPMITMLFGLLDKAFMEATAEKIGSDEHTKALIKADETNPFTRIGQITMTRNKLQEIMDSYSYEIKSQVTTAHKE